MAKAGVDKKAGRKKPGPKPKPRAASSAKAKPKTKAASEGTTAETLYADSDADVKAQVEAVLKRYRGRPTKYEPRFCDMVILWGQQGKSKAWMCGEIMITPQTMANWAAENPEFLEALEIAKFLSQLWWENQGQDNLRTVGFQGSVWSRNMAARFPADWTERKERNVTMETHEEALNRLAAMELAGA